MTLVLAGLAAGACQHKASPEVGATPAISARAPASPAPATATPELKRFGAALPPSSATPVAQVLSAPEGFQGKPILVEGYVRRACTRRGCWMELASGPDTSLEGCRVTFKDYGFFVPTDSAGSRARVEANLELATLSPAAVDHMEHEGAAFRSKAADGSAREVRLVASGVELWR